MLTNHLALLSYSWRIRSWKPATSSSSWRFTKVATVAMPLHLRLFTSMSKCHSLRLQRSFQCASFNLSQCHRPIAFSQRHTIHVFNGAGCALPPTVMLINCLQPT